MTYTTIAVIIPALNEEQYIEKCINSVLNNGYSVSNIEIIVCDGGSTDKTVEIIDKIAAVNTSVKLLNNKNKTAPFAFNLGINASSADVKMILGAHAVLHPGYINKCIEILNSSNEIACVGGVLNSITLSETSSAIALAMSSVFGVGSAHFRTGNFDGYVDTVAFGAYRSDVFSEIGLFDEELTRNQDDELNYRVTKAGYKIFLSKEIKADYYVRADFFKLFKQYYQYGYWKVFVNNKHKSLTSFRQLIPFFFVAGLLGGALLSLFIPGFIWLYVLGCSLYLVAAFLFSSRLSSKFSVIYKVVVSFFILHFSYGYGYMEGLIRFNLLKQKPSANKTVSSR